MINLEQALFFDIETHRVDNWDQLSNERKKAFINHYYDSQTYQTPEDHYSEIAGLYAEWSKVICIVFGTVNHVTKEFKTIKLYGKDEIEILESSRKIFDAYEKQDYFLAGHNIIACDVPYLAKRYIINSLKVPSILNVYGTKPWDLNYFDTMNFWRDIGDYKRVSLEVICATLGIPCKTDEIGGGNLYEYDIEDMDWDQLTHYCEEDVISNYKMAEHILKYYQT